MSIPINDYPHNAEVGAPCSPELQPIKGQGTKISPGTRIAHPVDENRLSSHTPPITSHPHSRYGIPEDQQSCAHRIEAIQRRPARAAAHFRLRRQRCQQTEHCCSEGCDTRFRTAGERAEDGRLRRLEGGRVRYVEQLLVDSTTTHANDSFKSAMTGLVTSSWYVSHGINDPF